MIDDTLTLKRDASAENAAVQGIVSLFVDKWNETSMKSSREITALVLTQIKDACIVVPKGEETEESTKLKHANSFFEKTIEQLKSNGPLPMVISGGNTYDDIISNLQNIRSAASGEEFELDIKNRLAFFLDKLNIAVSAFQNSEQSRKRKVLIYSVIAGFAIATLLWLVIGAEFGAYYFVIVLICGGFAYGALANVIK